MDDIAEEATLCEIDFGAKDGGVHKQREARSPGLGASCTVSRLEIP